MKVPDRTRVWLRSKLSPVRNIPTVAADHALRTQHNPELLEIGLVLVAGPVTDSLHFSERAPALVDRGFRFLQTWIVVATARPLSERR